MTQAGQRGHGQGGDEVSLEPDATTQLAVPSSRAGEGGTGQPRLPGGGTPAGSDTPAASDVSSPRREAPRPSLGARLGRRLRPRYPRPGRTGWRRWIPSWRQTLGGFLASLGLSALLLTVAYAATDIPDDLNTYATQQDNVYFWADGTPMARTGWVQRQAMPLDEIPEHVRSAVLAAENEGFYRDPGISFTGVARALFSTLGRGDTQGGSTITQQYVKNVYLAQDRTVGRKFTEAMIALKLDRRMSKNQILESYLNTSWFGRGTYGVQRAAQAYYGKDVSRLDVSEAAFLACLLKGAGLFDPALGRANHERAVERWSWILDRMVAIGKLSPRERATYKTFPEPHRRSPLSAAGGQSEYLVELAAQYAKKAAHLSDKDFDLGGHQVYTTFEKNREDRLTDAVTKAHQQARKDHPKTAGTARYGAASIATDGRILAVYGGPDHRSQGYNESNAATVPAGSTFLPFVYAAALENGIRKTRDGDLTPVTAKTLYNGDDRVPVRTPEGPYWDRNGRKVAAHNDGGTSYGRISLHRALALSANTPFMQLGMDTGLEKVRATAEAAGLLSSSIGAQVPTLSTGSSTPSAIRMADGYATFAADGVHTEPYSVRQITRNGHPVALDAPPTRRAMGAGTAREVTSALTDAFRAAHPDAAPASAALAGKAGTTEDDTAAWYVGTAKKVSTAVVAYSLDLSRSLEPLPLQGLGGTAADSVPYGIWSRAMSPLG
ncbi:MULTISPECIES: transglycosylase domain-containing protein [unclassified Streptomyces]|uniref:transglycosylase domain-containing protein n=1 Tax=unclassified Streptomyces TaxID=2593676 RepID=UPI00352FAB61